MILPLYQMMMLLAVGEMARLNTNVFKGTISTSHHPVASMSISSPSEISCAEACARSDACMAFIFKSQHSSCDILTEVEATSRGTQGLPMSCFYRQKDTTVNSFIPTKPTTDIPIKLTKATTTTTLTTTTSSTTTTTTFTTTTTTTMQTTKNRSGRQEETRIMYIAGKYQGKMARGQIDLKTHQISKYPRLTSISPPCEALCVMYWHKRNVIVMGTVSANRPTQAVMSVQLDKPYKEDTLKTDVGCYALAVDDDKDFLFMATKRPTKGVLRMEMARRSSRQMYRTKRTIPTDIAVDSSRQIVYLATDRDILQIPYNGKGEKTLKTNVRQTVLAIDVESRVLYYTTFKSLMSLSLSNSSATKVTTLPDDANSLLCSSRILYVGMRVERYVYEYNQDTKRSQQIDVLSKNHAKTQRKTTFILLTFLP